MTDIVNKKNIGMSGFVRLLNPKVVKTEKINCYPIWSLEK